MVESTKIYFSVSFDLVITNRELPYDLFVNSSSIETREHFVKVFAKNDSLTAQDLVLAKNKYHQFYVYENQREDFLKSLTLNPNSTEIEKGQFIKDSAIHYLDKLFDKEKKFDTILLSEILQSCQTTVQSMVSLLKNYDVEKVQLLISNLSFHDFYTYDHSINVSMYCISLYSSAKPNATNEEIVMAGMGGMLHDIGKLHIPNEIINKPFVLTADEKQVINQHPQYGHDLLKNNACQCKGVDFEVLKRIVHEHHENYNGTGYPNKIDGANMHFMTRVTAIADFFDAITTKRAYHDVLSTDEALRVMDGTKGKKIDPHLFNIFSINVNKLIFQEKIQKKLPDDFDPCQPHNILLFEKIKPDYKVADVGKNTKTKNHGKIKQKAS
jgi:HD-GYP domain-containing protein (c-di-GMP phosphodiesterase class II)